MTVPTPARLRVDNLPTVFPNAAGLDIGSAEIVAALPPDRDVPVRAFTTVTADLRELVTRLQCPRAFGAHPRHRSGRHHRYFRVARSNDHF